jgi:hypothetical protein
MENDEIMLNLTREEFILLADILMSEEVELQNINLGSSSEYFRNKYINVMLLNNKLNKYN